MLHSHPVERDRGTRTCLVSPLPLLPPLELPVAGSAARRRGYVISQPPPIASSLSSLFPSLTLPSFVELPAAQRRRRPSQIRNANTDGGGIRVAPSQWFRTLVK